MGGRRRLLSGPAATCAVRRGRARAAPARPTTGGVMYLQMDLKVLETHAPTAARAAGVPEDRILAGLLRLWHRCWSTNTDVVGRKELAGCFGPDRLDHLVEALLVDFLDEADGPGWRVRGADRYLRLRTARRAGAAKTNAARAQRRSSDAPATLKSDAPATQNHALITESPSTENTTTSTSSGSDAPATLQRHARRRCVRSPYLRAVDVARRRLLGVGAGRAEGVWLAAGTRNASRPECVVVQDTDDATRRHRGAPARVPQVLR